MSFTNRVRLPIFFSKPQFPVEQTRFRLSNGTTKTQGVVIRNTYEGKTDQLPEDWHRKIVIALAHDTVNVEGERLLSQVSLDGDYGIDWQDFLNNPIAQATVRLEVTPFNATNSNCQTCDQAVQLNLYDDHSDETWTEGSVHDFPDVLTDNDSICCSPFVISLSSYNTDYIASASIDPVTGVLTAVVKAEVPDTTQALIATYRVTCSDGSYDEADVYVNLSGTGSPTCDPPIGPIQITGLTNESVYANWVDAVSPPGVGYIWQLYLTADLGTVLQSGTVGVSEVTILGLTYGAHYTLVVFSDCGAYDYSTNISVNFIAAASAGNLCGGFTVTYLPNVSTPPQSISFMDCNGNIENLVFTFAQSTTPCMLLDNTGNAPLFFVASTPDITIATPPAGIC